MTAHSDNPGVTTASHWGALRAWAENGRIRVEAFAEDHRPTPNLEAIAALPFMESRIRRPAARKSFLAKRAGHAALRGRDEWVPLSWEEALDLAGAEINRIYDLYGPSAVWGHSYGWKSSGAVHSPVSLVRRLLALRGGFLNGDNNYSNAAMRKILPYVIGEKHVRPQSLAVIAEKTERLVFWGADPDVTNDIDWFAPVHADADYTNRLIEKARKGEIRAIALNPVRPSTAEKFGAEWIPVRPGTDCALMAALCQVLDAEGLADRGFLSRCTHGSEKFLAYIRGDEDGTPKTPEWASPVTGVWPDRIRTLARELAGHRSYLIFGWGPQRAKYGEQFHWMAYALGAMLGQIGLPGGGVSGESHTGSGGAPQTDGSFVFNLPTPRAPAVEPRHPFEGSRVIPVARFVDCIENPGKTIRFNGTECTYPTLRLLFWAGGNPFAHQPDTLRLERAWRNPQVECAIVCDTHWTATAKHADIVLPACTFFERNDITGIGEYSKDEIVAMHRVIEPMHDSRTDYWIFSELSKRLGIFDAFTEGKDEWGWMRALYAGAQQFSGGAVLPSFDDFWAAGRIRFEPTEEGRNYVDFADFRADPKAHPLKTPSGLIELYSETIEGFGYDDCPPHPAYLEPPEGFARATERFPLSLVAPKTKRRLHSQLDERANFRDGRQDFEPVEINPEDAAFRGISTGDLVLVRSARGAAMGRALVTDRVMRRVVALRHGAWFDPREIGDEIMDLHGNSNTLTMDEPASSLSCGNVASTANVEVRKWKGKPPAILAFSRPEGA